LDWFAVPGFYFDRLKELNINEKGLGRKGRELPKVFVAWILGWTEYEYPGAGGTFPFLWKVASSFRVTIKRGQV